MMGISSKGSFKFDLMIAFLKTWPGMKIAEPSKPTIPFLSGAGMFVTSSADSHAARSWTDGTMIRVSTKAEFKSGRMIAARTPQPIMHVTLLSGRDLVPPKLLGERELEMVVCCVV